MKYDVRSLYVLEGVGVSFQLVIWFSDDLFWIVVRVIDLNVGVMVNFLVLIVVVDQMFFIIG